MSKFVDEFKKFSIRGNVIDMAVGIIVGGAFTTIVNSLVADVIMPPMGLLTGDVDLTNFFLVLKQGNPVGPYLTIAEAQAAGAVTLRYGLFLTKITSFVIIAIAMFFLIRGINRLKELDLTRAQEAEATAAATAPAEPTPPPAPTTKECPYCLSTVPIRATRCPHCTSELELPPELVVEPGADAED